MKTPSNSEVPGFCIEVDHKNHLVNLGPKKDLWSKWATFPNPRS